MGVHIIQQSFNTLPGEINVAFIWCPDEIISVWLTQLEMCG